MELLNECVRIAGQIHIDQHNRESDVLDHIERLLGTRSQKNLPIAIQNFASALRDGAVRLDRGMSCEGLVASLVAIPGIGH